MQVLNCILLCVLACIAIILLFTNCCSWKPSIPDYTLEVLSSIFDILTIFYMLVMTKNGLFNAQGHVYIVFV